MNLSAFQQALDERLAKYDLLCHPFYQAWSAGALTCEDLSAYAAEYYHQVANFPSALAAFAARLSDGPMRRAVLANLADEEGRDARNDRDSRNGGGRPHAEIWLDFAEGMGASRDDARTSAPCAEVAALTEHFTTVAETGAPEAALAAFYAFESQVPRIALEKARGLRAHYAADDRTCGYFDLHATADIYHSNVWREQLSRLIASDPPKAANALDSAEHAAHALWTALDGIERQRHARAA